MNFDKGSVAKSFIYNSLDSSSKFYTETEYNEQGQTVAEIDETGENRTEYEFRSSRAGSIYVYLLAAQNLFYEVIPLVQIRTVFLALDE